MPGANLRPRGGYCRTDVLSIQQSLAPIIFQRKLSNESLYDAYVSTKKQGFNFQSSLGVSSIAISGDGRYLLKDGSPWLANVAAGTWNFIQAVNNTDSSSFIDTLASAGFNCCDVSLISKDVFRFPGTSGNHYGAPDWNNGSAVPPFTTPGNFGTLNSTYSTHALDRIDYALSKFDSVIVQSAYLGYGAASGSSNEGWGPDMEADTDAHMTAYGVAAGTLLQNRSKVIWGVGGDALPSTGGTLESRAMAIVNGIRSVDPSKLWVGHMDGFSGGTFPYDQTAIGAIPGMIWSHYGYDVSSTRAWWRIEEAWAHSPTRPAFVLDPSYENDGTTSSRGELRARTHMTMCSGACSLAYARGGSTGVGWVYMATSSWTTTQPGLGDHQVAYSIWNALPWYSMSPDLTSVYVTSGRGTHSATSDNWLGVRASTACLVAYYQDGASLSPVYDLSKFTGAGSFSSAGQRRCRKIDPFSGTATSVSGSPFTTSGTTTISQASLGTNSGGATDWILVFD